jgi:hypothetical protein
MGDRIHPSILGGLKMNIDDYQFHTNSPVSFGFYTSEIPIRKIPFPTLDLSSSHAFKESEMETAME